MTEGHFFGLIYIGSLFRISNILISYLLVNLSIIQYMHAASHLSCGPEN